MCIGCAVAKTLITQEMHRCISVRRDMIDVHICVFVYVCMHAHDDVRTSRGERYEVLIVSQRKKNQAGGETRAGAPGVAGALIPLALNGFKEEE